ncbi:transcriptional regulator with XRE-family HTH domain [Pseudomonas nitritireducens]|uniref:Transcriptional regulator with XRE-family HTH domain n=1 Tax=Pseudomonas nitroreducens TaxID=46680 RepID=A0A7W7KSR9_PSENT|nr:helix-turn-helix transcriptional regulator [Pseudomonas nitritireducens]MBB4868274.1 transcriptional regulator with XRE-family HTH domain [Pseudomonas nitritireducens]
MLDTDQKAVAESIGRAIARQRVRCEMTQEQVAEQLGVGNEAVSRIERGVVMPTVLRLLELAAIFDCEAAELLSEASLRTTDQASRLAQLLSGLKDHDRQLVVGIVEQLSERLRSQKAAKH